MVVTHRNRGHVDGTGLSVTVCGKPLITLYMNPNEDVIEEDYEGEVNCEHCLEEDSVAKRAGQG